MITLVQSGIIYLTLSTNLDFLTTLEDQIKQSKTKLRGSGRIIYEGSKDGKKTNFREGARSILGEVFLFLGGTKEKHQPLTINLTIF